LGVDYFQEGHFLYPQLGGIHHIYANPKALAALAGQKPFPDGSVLVLDVLEARGEARAILEGARRRVLVMEKDKKRFARTGGWGYEAFVGDTRERTVKDGGVERATAGLRGANRELLEAAQRLFAARRELARSQRLALAGGMAASVAHQVGTPLNVISGHVQLLRAEQEDGSAGAQRLRTIQEQIARVTAIVQSLLDETRRPELELRPLAPGTLVKGLAELVRPSLVGRGIELGVEVAAGLPAVAVDRVQLEQAFLNLITNAIDAMPDGGRLSLAARPEGEAVAFVVTDSGAGIPPEDLSRVFEPLYTTKPPGQGTGLGLPILREIVLAHGGSVRLESRMDEGTTAVVCLPAHARPA
jgi:signal transduction histidine kinase